MTQLAQQLQKFDPISLEEMDAVRLMNRTDTKYITNTDMLLKLLPLMTEKYRLLKVNGKSISSYETRYLDTKDYLLYRQHHNGKLNRYKFRFRKYIESDIYFLEAKYKTNKGRTIKTRIPVDDFENQLSVKSIDFLSEVYPNQVDQFMPQLKNYFSRLTFVHKHDKERLTIDINLRFEANNAKSDLGNIVIIELKRGNQVNNSDVALFLKQLGIYSTSISKYCTGCAITNPTIKQNNFKPKLRYLEKIAHGIT